MLIWKDVSTEKYSDKNIFLRWYSIYLEIKFKCLEVYGQVYKRAIPFIDNTEILYEIDQIIRINLVFENLNFKHS